MVSELVLHLAKEDAPRVHIRLCQYAVRVSATAAQGEVAPVITYYLSPLDLSLPLFSNVRMAVPSIRLAAELPRNLLRGFRVPSIRMWCSGTM